MTSAPLPSTDLISALWRGLSARRTFLVLVIPLTLALFAATFLPQIHGPSTPADAAPYQRRLLQEAATYGSWGPLLQNLGLFTLARTFWFRALLALLALHNLVRVADQVQLWRRLQEPSPGFPLPPRGLAVLEMIVPAPLADTEALLRDELSSRFRRVVDRRPARDPDDPSPVRLDLHATRGAWGAAGNALAYLGPVLVLLALFGSEQLGWRQEGLLLAPGQALHLRERPDIEIAAVSVDDPGRLTIRMGQTNEVVTIRPGAPVAAGSVRLFQTGDGPALRVAVHDANDRALPIRPLVGGNQADQQTVLFERPQEEQNLAVPARSLLLRAVSFAELPAQGFNGPVFLVQAFTVGTDEPVFSRYVAQAARLSVGTDTYTVEPLRYLRLDATFDPGLLPAMLGGLLTIAGIVLAQAKPPARAWAWLAGRDRETAVTLAVLGSGPWTRVELAALQDPLAGLALMNREPAASSGPSTLL